MNSIPQYSSFISSRSAPVNRDGTTDQDNCAYTGIAALTQATALRASCYSADQVAAPTTTQSSAASIGLYGCQIVKTLAASNAPFGGIGMASPRFVLEDNQGRFWMTLTRGGRVDIYDERSGQWDQFTSELAKPDPSLRIKYWRCCRIARVTCGFRLTPG